MEIGKYVKILLKNNVQVDGIIEQWTKEQVILKSSNDSIIIFNPNDNIVVIRIINESPKKPKDSNKHSKLEKLEKQFKEVYDSPNDIDNLRLKKMIELKKLLADQDKKIISEKLKQSEISKQEPVIYGYPGFFKKQDSK